MSKSRATAPAMVMTLHSSQEGRSAAAMTASLHRKRHGDSFRCA